MGVAAGGRIDQTIVKDPGMHKWDASKTLVFNMQILNTANFQAVTGVAPPPPPIDAKTYASYGYPFFSMYEEPSDIAGNFSGVKSIGEIRNVSDSPLKPREVQICGNSSTDGVGFFNNAGPMSKFRTVKELEEEVYSRGRNIF